MLLPSTYSRYIFSERPTKDFTPTTFAKQTRSLSELSPSANQVLVQVTWLSLDPAMRSWLRDVKRPYTEPVNLGDVMRAGGIGVVVKVGERSKFAVGDEVSGTFGWAEYALMDDKAVRNLIVPPGAQTLDYLGVLGFSGLTSYFGLFDVGKLKSGETLVVSGAAGSVGSICCQIGKLKGAKVIAIAGGPEKCSWLENELGVNLALDYKSSDFHERFKKEAGFVDVYFDNVGGEILNFVMTRMNRKGRIVICGAISDYNTDGRPTGLTSYMSLISQRVRMEGFVVFDYAAEFATAIKELSQWLSKGLLKGKFHVVEGLDNAPRALPMLYNGGNTGKLVVKVSEIRFDSKL